METSANDNIITYARTEERSFAECAPTDVDLLVFSALAYATFETVEGFPHDAPVRVADLLRYGTPADYMGKDCNPRAMEELLAAAVASPRFGAAAIARTAAMLDESRVIQFGAVAFDLPGDTTVIAFRGTDTSLVGWHEDLLMLSLQAVPAQIEALDFARRAIRKRPERTYLICGHSKGGSCAEYAALFLNSRQAARVARAVSFDGPALSRIGGTLEPELASYDADIETFYRQCTIPLSRYAFESEIALTMEYRDFDRFTYVAGNDPDLTHNVCSQRVVDGRFVPRVPTFEEMWDGLAFTRLARQLRADDRRFFATFVTDACREAHLVPDLSPAGTAALKKALAAQLGRVSPADRTRTLHLAACWRRATAGALE